MSQVSTSPVSVSLPPVTYKGQPVCTTEMLAEAYGCTAKNIQDNFANNRDRFVEGKHYLSITNGEIREFRLHTEIFGLQISRKARHLTLWLERGAARHAKMLNTDKAWDVFELLEETFFRTVPPEVLPEPVAISDTFPGTLSITPSTVADRQPLRSLVNAWAQVSGQPFNVCWNQLKAAFRLTNIKDLPQEWIPDAIDWGQAKIDALPKGLPAGTVGNASTVAAVPGNPLSPGSKPLPLPAPLPEAATEEYARRAAALAELEREALKWECDARDRFRELQRRYSDLTGSAFSTLLNRVPVRSFVSTDFMVDVLAGQFGNAYRGMDTAFQDVQYAIRAAIAANRVLAASV
ncbi:MAG: ORF6N domain-containing protein [Desulfovibrionaceae bacterium]|nr:ORF6N domain-containing protein [Desulfovibrionaceae bacterium]